MSGPKVVRIVTREEIIKTCKDILAQLDAETRRWERIGRRNELLSDEVIAATRRRSAQLAALLAADRFLDLQRQVPEEIAFLQADTQKRLDEAASKAAMARLEGRRFAALAEQILERCQRGEIALPDKLNRNLEAVVAAQGADRTMAQTALSEVHAMALKGASPRALTPEQQAQVDRLKAQGTVEGFDAWIKRQAPQPEVKTIEVEGAIEALRLAGAEAMASQFSARARAIEGEPSKARRQMLTDTLMLEVAKAVADARAEGEQLRQLEPAAAPLDVLESGPGKELSRQVAMAVAEGDAASARELLPQVVKLLAEERKAFAAQAQRTAVLRALKELGYEVSEGMETATPKDGKVVLRRAANQDMGVQITGIDSADRVQLRPVRFGQPRTEGDRSKDRDIETLWCSDFDRLNGKISATQGFLKLEQAHAMGAVPVLFVGENQSADDRRPEMRRPAQTRTIS